MRERTERRERLMAGKELRKDACLIVPCYRHVEPLLESLESLRARGMLVIAVDDGNAPEESAKLAAAASESVMILRNEENMGKGASVIRGFQKAAELGFTYAVQIDADGQIDTGGIADVLAASEKSPGALSTASRYMTGRSTGSALSQGTSPTSGWRLSSAGGRLSTRCAGSGSIP